MKHKTFITFFPNYEDFHFWKDPGQIPFRFQRLGYKSTILTCLNGEYPETRRFLDVECLQRKIFFNKDLGLISYFMKNSKKIDILNVFHLHSYESLFAAFIYKICNPKGFVYLKMDNSHFCGIFPWEEIFDKNVTAASYFAKPKDNWKWKIKKKLVKNYFVKKINLFSIEDEASKKYYENKYTFLIGKIIVAHNGHTIDLVSKDIRVRSLTEKEDIIITVGRLGTFPKNTLMLLRGFAATAALHNWNLELAGSIDPNFVSEKDNFILQHQALEHRIKFLGNLDKPELFDLYNRAKIFLLPSNFEGFAIVYSEAAFFGTAIITTPYTSLKQIIDSENIGCLVEPENPNDIGNAILELINDKTHLQECCKNSQKFAERSLNWDKIVENINNAMEERF